MAMYLPPEISSARIADRRICAALPFSEGYPYDELRGVDMNWSAIQHELEGSGLPDYQGLLINSRLCKDGQPLFFVFSDLNVADTLF